MTPHHSLHWVIICLSFLQPADCCITQRGLRAAPLVWGSEAGEVFRSEKMFLLLHQSKKYLIPRIPSMMSAQLLPHTQETCRQTHTLTLFARESSSFPSISLPCVSFSASSVDLSLCHTLSQPGACSTKFVTCKPWYIIQIIPLSPIVTCICLC